MSERTKWDEDKVSKLREMASIGFNDAEIAHVIGCTPSAAGSAKAARKFKSAASEATSCREALRAGTCLVRDEPGGSIPYRWTTANRSGETFPPVFCERALELGWLKFDGRVYRGNGPLSPV